MPSPEPCDAGRPEELQPLEARRLAETLDEAALREALSESLLSGAMERQLLSAEVEALREVASRFGPRPLVQEPIAVELVAAMLDVNYRGLKRPPEFWRSLAAKIAAVLCEAPAARARLESLWGRLVEAYGSDA